VAVRDHSDTDESTISQIIDRVQLWDVIPMTHAQETCTRNLYKKLAPNRTQLYSVPVSYTRKFQTQSNNHTAQWLHGSVKSSCASFFVQVSWECVTPIIPVTHAPETGPINRLHFFRGRVSCKSGTGFIWYQIPAPIRLLFYSKPESGVHVTEIMTYDWSAIIVYISVCFLV